MKKLILFFFAITLSGYVIADNSGIWKSSWTITADTTQNLCVNKRGFLHSVVIGTATATTSSLTIWASSGTVNSTMTVIDSSVKGDYFFDTVAISTFGAGSFPRTGLTYSTVGNGSVNILYECY